MGLFDNLFGGAVSGGLGMLGQLMNVGYQKSLQDHAAAVNYKYAEKSARNQPTWTRVGLENAGYNPMLAVQNATSGANSSWTSAGQSNPVDLAGDVSTGIANAQSFQRLKNETSQTESINDKNYAEADEAKVRKQSLIQRLPFISQREKAEIGNIEKDSMKKEAEIHNIEETTRFIQKDFELRKRLGEMGLNVQRYGIDKNLAGIIYNADTNERNSIRSNETQRGTRTDKLPFGIGSTYYDMRGEDKRMRASNPNDRKYWRNYY